MFLLQLYYKYKDWRQQLLFTKLSFFLLNTISNINNVNVKKKIQTKNIRPTSPVYPEKVHTLTLLILQGVEHSV